MNGEPFSRRDFLKVAGVGAAASLVLSGRNLVGGINQLTPSSLAAVPLPGQVGMFATTCGACPAGCGLLVHADEGKVLGIEGNPAHPVNQGWLCARSQAALRQLNHPARFTGPVAQVKRGSGEYHPTGWDAATEVVREALRDNSPGEIAFLMGLYPDHLFDLVYQITTGLGAHPPLRYRLDDELYGRVTLIDASQRLFGVARVPYFDASRSEVIFSFGADLNEPWLSPALFSRSLEKAQPENQNQAGYWVQFGSRPLPVAVSAGEWVATAPGSEQWVAQAIHLLLETPETSDADLEAAVRCSGVSTADFRRLAKLFSGASRRLAIPGGAVLGSLQGLAATEAILSLNIAVGNLGVDGGVFLMPDSPVHPEISAHPVTLAEIGALIERMRRGEVRVLFVHGVDPASELPAALKFTSALQNVPLIVSFAPLLNDTARLADLILPDHTPLESWIYQRVTAADRMVVSGGQPVATPEHNSRSSASVLLDAVRGMDKLLSPGISYLDEIDFIQKNITALENQGGIGHASSRAAFWMHWQQQGGWWQAERCLWPPVTIPTSLDGMVACDYSVSSEADGDLILLPFLTSYKGENRKRLPQAFVSAQIHPDTAERQGFQHGDWVHIKSDGGAVQAVISVTADVHPGVVAVSLISAGGRLYSSEEVNSVTPLDLLLPFINESGSLASNATRVSLSAYSLEPVW